MRQIFLATFALVGASASAMAATDTERLQEWVRLDAEIHRATQALASDADADAFRPAIEELLKRVDAINIASDARRDESASSRAKRDALRGPLYNLRLALDQPAMASRMANHSVQPRGPLMSAEGVAGVGCEQAIELVPGEPLRIEIPTKASRWITVRSPLDASPALAATTVGSDIDAAVSVYADCSKTGEPAITSGDDNYGLQAIALLPPAAQPLMVEIRNQGARGIATIGAIPAVTITGRITRSDTGASISNLNVDAFQGSGPTSIPFAGSAISQSNGSYQLVTYSNNSGPNTYVRTHGPDFGKLYIDKTWNDVPCPAPPYYGVTACGPGTPSPVATAGGVTVSNIDFALSTGATIYGQVVDRSGNAAQAVVSFNLIGTPSATAWTASTDASGRYRITALPNGQFRLVAGGGGYKNQVFDGFDCGTDCDLITGTPVSASASAPSVANFSLSRASSIRVSVTVEGQPPFSNVIVIAEDGTGSMVTNAAAYEGTVLLGPLPAGSYRIRTLSQGLVSEYYQDIPCSDDCGPAEFQAATPIIVVNDAPPVEIAMDLARVPELTGMVTDTSGAPIANAHVSIRGGTFFGSSAQTGADGAYRLQPESTGSFLVRASSPDHVDEVYDDVPCPGFPGNNTCPGTTLINIIAGIAPAPVNFQLAPSASVRGRVTSNPMNLFFRVDALSSLNRIIDVGIFTQRNDSTYLISDLPPGQYRFGLSGGYARLQLFQNVDCGASVSNFSQCQSTGATVVNLFSGSIADDIDFTYRNRLGRLGTVTDESTGLPLSGVILDLFNSQNGEHVTTVTTASDGRFDMAPINSFGTYVLATDNYLGYINEVYQNIDCPTGSVFLGTCGFSGATPLAFPGDGSELSIALRRDALFRSGFE